MKLFEILNERDTQVDGTKLTDQHFDLAYKYVKNSELDINEIADISVELASHEEFDRSKDSAKFILTRLHILVHGIAPQGINEKTASEWFKASKAMNNYARSKGHDVEENLVKARAELKHRKTRAKVNKPTAKKIMIDFYNNHRDALVPQNEISKHRNQIEKDIMDGKGADIAFRTYFK